MKFVSRATLIYLLVAIISLSVMVYRWHEFRVSCLAYMRAHESQAYKPTTAKKSMTADLDVIDWCAYQDPSPIPDRILALILVVSFPLFLGRLIRDIFASTRQRETASPS